MAPTETALNSSVGKLVNIRMKNGREYQGILTGFDEYTNIVLTDAEETGENPRKFKSIILKGGLIASISSV